MYTRIGKLRWLELSSGVWADHRPILKRSTKPELRKVEKCGMVP
jgi:hypothetical protein